MKENKKKGMIEKRIDKILDVFFDKTKRNVLLLTLLGFILRLISARNTGVYPDDTNHAVDVIGIFGAKRLFGYDHLWYYIQEIFYKIFGATQMGSRLASVLFGTLSVILMFLFVKRVFKSEKAAMISSFFIAVSPMLIKYSLPELDIACSFFVLFSAYFLFGYLETKSNRQLIWSFLLIGVGIMIKLYALFFAMSFIIFLIFKELKSKDEKKFRKIINKIILFGVIIFILIIPLLAYNYLVYKEKGFMDFIFTNTLNLGKEKAKEYYGWDSAWNKGPDYKDFFFGSRNPDSSYSLPRFITVAGFLSEGDPILFILGLLGLIFAFKRNRDYFWFFLLTFLPVFIYVGSQSAYSMSKHFIFGLVLLAPFAGDLIIKFNKKFTKIRIKHILLVILLFNLFYLGIHQNGPFYSQSSFAQVMKFKEKNIPDNSLIVADSRIYRGYIHWAFNGKNYVESGLFFNIANEVNARGNLQNVEVYYIECVCDDCGWGTIKDQPEFNKSMEDVTAWFANLSFYSEDFKEPDRTKYYFPFIIGEKKIYYRVYKLNLMLNPSIFPAVKKVQGKYLWYPIGYDREIAPLFDEYNAKGTDILIEKTAMLILYLEIAFSFFIMIYIPCLFLKQGKNEDMEQEEKQNETEEKDEFINNNPRI